MVTILILLSIFALTCENIIDDDEISWTSPETLEDKRGWVTAGLILINIKRNKDSWTGLRENFVFMIDSLLSYTPNTNIHFIVITDDWTRNGRYFWLHQDRHLSGSVIQAALWALFSEYFSGQMLLKELFEVWIRVRLILADTVDF